MTDSKTEKLAPTALSYSKWVPALVTDLKSKFPEAAESFQIDSSQAFVSSIKDN
jgi:hypothetical protein